MNGTDFRERKNKHDSNRRELRIALLKSSVESFARIQAHRFNKQHK